MTRKELNLKILKKPAKGVLWQPRLGTWISHHMECGTMPERFRNMEELEIYDALGCSIRYAASEGIEQFEAGNDVSRIEEKYPNRTVEKNPHFKPVELCTSTRTFGRTDDLSTTGLRISP